MKIYFIQYKNNTCTCCMTMCCGMSMCMGKKYTVLDRGK